MLSTVDSALLQVRLTPKGGMDALTKYQADTLHVRVAAPPIDGAANRSLVSLLSKSIGIPKSRISIVSGETSRNKIVRFDGLNSIDLNARMDLALGPHGNILEPKT